jgi:hypothetical protein
MIKTKGTAIWDVEFLAVRIVGERRFGLIV